MLAGLTLNLDPAIIWTLQLHFTLKGHHHPLIAVMVLSISKAMSQLKTI